MAEKTKLQQFFIWVFRLGLMLAVLGLIQHLTKEKEEIEPMGATSCVIECNRTAAASVSANRSDVCLTRADNHENACYAPDEILMVTLGQGKTIVYDYQGKGLYVNENLNKVQQLIKQADRTYIYLQRVNRQEIVNLRYTLLFNKCTRQLELEEEFETTVAKGKVKEVLELLYRTCSIM
jgi:hypothetical protein